MNVSFLHHAHREGLLTESEKRCALSLIEQGCTLEQALIGSQIMSKEQFVDVLSQLGVEEGEYAFQSRNSKPQQQRLTINQCLRMLLQTADESGALECSLTPVSTQVVITFSTGQHLTIPLALYPALKMRWLKWGKKLGWHVEVLALPHQESLRCMRLQNDEQWLTPGQKLALKEFEATKPMVLILHQPSRYLQAYHIADKPVMRWESMSDTEAVLHATLLGERVLVVTQRDPVLLRNQLEYSGIPVIVS